MAPPISSFSLVNFLRSLIRIEQRSLFQQRIRFLHLFSFHFTSDVKSSFQRRHFTPFVFDRRPVNPSLPLHSIAVPSAALRPLQSSTSDDSDLFSSLSLHLIDDHLPHLLCLLGLRKNFLTFQATGVDRNLRLPLHAPRFELQGSTSILD